MVWLLLVLAALPITLVAMKPWIVRRLLDAMAWPMDETLGTLPLLTPPKLQAAYHDRRVLVVGGTRGVGFAIAQTVVDAGGHVTIVGRNPQTGQRALERLGPKATFVEGNIGTVANAKAMLTQIQKIVEETSHRFDYLVVTAAVYPDWSAPSAVQADGIDVPFAVAVVGRYVVYQATPTFLSEEGRILNVLCSGQGPPQLKLHKDVILGRRPAKSLLESVLNFGAGNEVALQVVDRDPALQRYTRISTHPGFLKTDLHRGQGWWLDAVEWLSVALAGVSIEECGLRQASILACANLQPSHLSFVSSDMKGRLASASLTSLTEEELPWMEELLQTLLKK